MKQRVAIARALALEPRMLLMDEPFGAVDALTREKLQLELLDIWREHHRTVLFVTHSVEEAVLLGTRVLVMSARPGRIQQDVTVTFPEDGAPEGRSSAVRTSQAFVDYKEKIASAIYHAHR